MGLAGVARAAGVIFFGFWMNEFIVWEKPGTAPATAWVSAG